MNQKNSYIYEECLESKVQQSEEKMKCDCRRVDNTYYNSEHSAFPSQSFVISMPSLGEIAHNDCVISKSHQM